VPILRDFERRLGGLVEGLFAKTFRSGLQPVELAKRLIREQDAGRTVGVHEVWAPNRFEFGLSPDDAEHFKQAEAALIRELKQVVRDNAAEHGYGLMGPPEVELAVDEGIKRGEFTCVASLVEGEEKVEPAGPAGGAALVIHEDGEARTFRLGRGTTTIGRQSGNEVEVTDPAASRRHAQIHEEGGRYTITDLGSTNGTQLNGEVIQSRTLQNGDRITIGTTVLEFREG
jgi:hypothetical protein